MVPDRFKAALAPTVDIKPLIQGNAKK